MRMLNFIGHRPLSPPSRTARGRAHGQAGALRCTIRVRLARAELAHDRSHAPTDRQKTHCPLTASCRWTLAARRSAMPTSDRVCWLPRLLSQRPSLKALVDARLATPTSRAQLHNSTPPRPQTTRGHATTHTRALSTHSGTRPGGAASPPLGIPPQSWTGPTDSRRAADCRRSGDAAQPNKCSALRLPLACRGQAQPTPPKRSQRHH